MQIKKKRYNEGKTVRQKFSAGKKANLTKLKAEEMKCKPYNEEQVQVKTEHDGLQDMKTSFQLFFIWSDDLNVKFFKNGSYFYSLSHSSHCFSLHFSCC